MKLRFN